MNQKILWKIEELWKKYYKPDNVSSISLEQLHGNYNNNQSQYHERFFMVDTFGFNESKNIVFKDDYGKYKGLEKLQVTMINDTLVYLIDNHNEILYPFVELKTVSDTIFDVVHIDAHPDDAEFQGEKKNELNLENIKEYIAETRISDFFDAVSGAQLIGNVHRVCHSNNFEFFLPPEKPYILSLDVDIFGPEGDFAEIEDKVRAIALAWSRADVVVVAMSPGFIDQKYAQEIIKIFTTYI
ncbi:hypothetical protein CL684_01605 [Candidatus Campbellbacteria bacterium]|nr:hypothetical protein [Candidatus Campbellbacteria bacterium]|tara:strand:- start:1353 stop:2072 length:720 start_codon:yes stop_codon:yes gene_type:complete